MAPENVSAARNDDVVWDRFDPEKYLEHNYLSLRWDDEEILGFVRDHFAGVFGAKGDPTNLRGIDVGTGPNLYPALSMLPFCDKVILFEHARPNLRWLREQRADGWPSWSTSWAQFWKVLCEQKVYARLDDPRAKLKERTRILDGNVYRLERLTPFDVGTMFFVAESITESESEFRSAMDHFLNALAPGAPFAIALMEHSKGYHVADSHFPAIDIDEAAVRRCLDGWVSSSSIERIKLGDKPLREGYEGMLIALGQIKD